MLSRARPSLQRRIGLSLSIAIAVAGLLAVALAYAIAFFETNELQDAQLLQISALVAQQASFPSAGRFEPKDSEDAETHLVVKRLGLKNAIADVTTDLDLPSSLRPGLQTIEQSGVSWRVLVDATTAGERFAVAQRMTVRDELARDSALMTLLPLVLLVPLLLLVIRSVLRRAFAPLAELSRTVDLLGDQTLVPLQTQQVPTEALGLVQAVNRLLDRLRLTLAQQRRLISDAAHELRTPVTALMVQADNLANVPMPAEARDRMQPLRQGLVRMAALLEQLLGLARLQGGPTTPIAELDLRDVVRDLVETLSTTARARQVDLGCLRIEPAPVKGHAVNAQALVRNAIDNAIKYTPVGGAVDVSVYREGASAILVVEDSGPGIPASEREQVFEPFVRLLGSREVGSGLGLAIARSAAEALGGRIQLADRLDGASGLRFVYVQAVA